MKSKVLAVLFVLALMQSACGGGVGGGGNGEGHYIDVPGRIVTECFDLPGDTGDVWLLADKAHKLTDDVFSHENVSFGPGDTIYFSRQTPGDDQSAELWKMDTDGGDKTQLTFTYGVDYHPTVSPDGQKIVWWSNRSGPAHLWIMNQDGSGPAELITGSTVDTFDPEFSPDGTMLAFNRSLDGGTNAEIWVGVLNPARDGFSDSWALTGTGYSIAEVDPTWAPDNKTIAYSAYEGPGAWPVEGLLYANLQYWKIYMIEVDSANRTGINKRLLVDGADDPGTVSWLPCFSGGGDKVAFIRSIFDPAGPGGYPFGTVDSSLWVIRTDRTGESQIRGTGGCYWFDWDS